MSREDIFVVMVKLQYFERINVELLYKFIVMIGFFIMPIIWFLYYMDCMDIFTAQFLIAMTLCLFFLLPILKKSALKRFLKYSELYEVNDKYTDEELFHKVNNIDIENEEGRPLFLKFENIKKSLLQQTILKDSSIQVKLDRLDKLILKVTGTTIN